MKKVNGFFYRLVANGHQGKYPIGWKIVVERCPFTKNSQYIDYVGEDMPKLGKIFGEFVMPNTDGKNVKVVCTKIEPGWEQSDESA